MLDIVNFLPDPTLAIDLDGRVIFWNKAIELTTGIKAEDIIGKGDFEYSLPLYGCRIPMLIDLVLKPNLKTELKYINLQKNGKELTAETIATHLPKQDSILWVKAAPLFDNHGNITGAIESFRDITEQYKARVALQESEAHLRRITDNMLDMICQIDSKGVYQYVGQSHKTNLGYEIDELIGRTVFEFIHPDDRPCVQSFMQSVKSSIGEKIECRYRHSNGHYIWLETTASPLKDDNHKLVEMICASRNITLRKSAEENLLQSTAELRSVFSVLPDLYFRLDSDGIILNLIAGDLEDLYLPPEKLIGQKLYDLPSSAARALFKNAINQVLLDKSLVVLDYSIPLKGKVQHFEARFLPLLDNQIIVVVRNITERKQAEEALRLDELRFESLYKLSQMKEKSKQEIINFALEMAIELTGSQVGYITFTSDDEKFLTMFSWSKNALKTCKVETKETVFLTEKTGLWGEAVRQRKPVITNDYNAFNPTKKGYPKGHIPIIRHMNIPLLEGDRVVLVAGVGNKRSDYNDSDIKQLSLMMDGVWKIIQKKRTEDELLNSYKNLRNALDGAIYALSLTAEKRDPYTAGHQRRVGNLAFAIAKELGLSEERIEGVYLASSVHDLGKIYIPGEILCKPGMLRDNEFSIVKDHPQMGYDILKTVEFPWPIADIVLQHHERINGSGYPFGLKDDEILLEAKIISVADVVEAMSSHRPYRPSLGIEKAIDEITKGSGILYDQRVVEACLKLLKEEKFQFPDLTA